MKKSVDAKLLVRVSCTVCLGGYRKGVFERCPYCDADRFQIIEASFNTIKEALEETLTIKEKKELIKYLSKKQ